MTSAAAAPETATPRPAAPDAIVTDGLTKRFGSRSAVNELSVTVPAGVVAGFVGPNGSGKSTTLRMLLGLVRPTAGTARVLGLPISDPRAYAGRVGALIEGPAFYPSLSGRANLRTLATLGGHDGRRVDGLLELVGLADRAGDHFSSYSMGMKQRLGVAAAMLPDPALLILDEPVNGLDPPGIIEMRGLMRRLRDEGKTVFVSSHLLGEVEQVADWLVVLERGRSLYCGPAGSLPGRGEGELVVAPERREQVDIVLRIATEHGHPAHRNDDGTVTVVAPAAFAGELNRLCMQAEVTLVELRRSSASLEERFLAMIGGGG